MDRLMVCLTLKQRAKNGLKTSTAECAGAQVSDGDKYLKHFLYFGLNHMIFSHDVNSKRNLKVSVSSQPGQGGNIQQGEVNPQARLAVCSRQSD